MSSGKVIRVLVAEDSGVTCKIIVNLLESDERISVVGVATDGEQAVALAKQLRPDLITMDVQMPKLDGLEATKQIMQDSPTSIIILSSLTDAEMDLNFKALQAGALEVMTKPKRLRSGEFDKIKRELIDAIITMSEVKPVRRWDIVESTSKPRVKDVIRGGNEIEIIGIGSSTGGPAALSVLLSNLPASFPVPIVIVQHIAAGFTSGMVGWFNRNTELSVQIAKANIKPLPGNAYVASQEKQLIINDSKLFSTLRDKHGDEYIPSVNRLFRSIAEIYGEGGMGIILTGMGNDGAQGLAAIKNAGGFTIAQNESSSVVFGMPFEAIKLGAARSVLDISAIADEMCRIVGAS